MSWLDNFFGGGRNPSDAAQGYIGRIPGETKQYFDPFFQAGKNAIPGLQNQYDQLLNDPGKRLNQIGEGYQQSPGFQFALQQALQGSGHAAAAGGLAGSPQHEQQNQELVTNLANQDYNNWIRNALGIYGQGLNGQQGLVGQGAQSGAQYGDILGQSLAQQGNLAFQGQRQQNQNRNDIFGNGLKFAGGAFGFPF